MTSSSPPSCRDTGDASVLPAPHQKVRVRPAQRPTQRSQSQDTQSGLSEQPPAPPQQAAPSFPALGSQSRLRVWDVPCVVTKPENSRVFHLYCDYTFSTYSKHRLILPRCLGWCKNEFKTPLCIKNAAGHTTTLTPGRLTVVTLRTPPPSWTATLRRSLVSRPCRSWLSHTIVPSKLFGEREKVRRFFMVVI